MLQTKAKNHQLTSPLHFARFEFKYLLSAQIRREIEKELTFFLQYDPFVADKEDHLYPVRSLYFDDPSLSAFYDKVDGLHSRSKYRIRTYSFDDTQHTPIFLEIKGRHNNLVYKHRVPIIGKHPEWNALPDNQLITWVLNQANKGAIVNQFEYDCIRKSLKPVALIDYKRRPYVSKFDSGFRITFDENLKVTKTGQLFPQPNKTVTKLVLPGYSVLEVKFRHHMPSWFHRMIQSYELKRISISKICTGLEVLGMAVDVN